VAAGESKRMGGLDKIFAELAGRPVLARVLNIFAACEPVDRIVVVMSNANLDRCRALVAAASYARPVDCIPGGLRRQDSVAAGLKLLGDCGWIVIHDGARPLVGPVLITRGLEMARDTGAAIAAVPLTDTVKLAAADLAVQETLPRERLWAAQTPQVFRRDIIERAYADNTPGVTDDAALVERLGIKVRLFPGSYDNIKVTNPRDLAVARALLEQDGK